MTDQRYLVLPHKEWLKWREQGLCEFTDEELETAVADRVPIRIGKVKYVGRVKMLVDSRRSKKSSI